MQENHSSITEVNWKYDYAGGATLWWSVLVLKVRHSFAASACLSRLWRQQVVVQRQSFYYVFNLVIPSTIITIVAVVGFHMPSTSGRVRLALHRALLLSTDPRSQPKGSACSRSGFPSTR